MPSDGFVGHAVRSTRDCIPTTLESRLTTPRPTFAGSQNAGHRPPGWSLLSMPSRGAQRNVAVSWPRGGVGDFGLYSTNDATRADLMSVQERISPR